jgi:phosphoribosylanthranilate isomerase
MSAGRTPSKTRIKFCGITRLEDALLAAELGVDLIGFVLVPGSPRQLSLEAAVEIRRALPAGPLAVALLQNPEAELIAAVRAQLAPDLLQFHGNEPATLVRSSGLPYIRAVPMGEPQRWADWERDYPDAWALLADSHGRQGGGGTGTGFAWSALPVPDQRQRPLILAGGLRPETVAEAVRQVRPWGVDVSSGIEAAKGIKDALKMRAFVAAVRAADA